MDHLVGLLYFIVSLHLVDAGFNYAKEKMTFSATMNFVLSLIAISVGASLM